MNHTAVEKRGTGFHRASRGFREMREIAIVPAARKSSQCISGFRASIKNSPGSETMSRKFLLSVSTLGFAAATLTFVLPSLGQVFVGTPAPAQFAGQGKPSTANGEWPTNGADVKFTRYSPLDQIDASNFNKLEPAWRFKTDALGPYPEYKLEGTPIMVKGVLYTTAGTRRAVSGGSYSGEYIAYSLPN
jgi:glucose dehydrogenase